MPFNQIHFYSQVTSSYSGLTRNQSPFTALFYYRVFCSSDRFRFVVRHVTALLPFYAFKRLICRSPVLPMVSVCGRRRHNLYNVGCLIDDVRIYFTLKYPCSPKSVAVSFSFSLAPIFV